MPNASITMRPLKVRAWKLAAGGFLVLVFIRRGSDTGPLELLQELEAENDAEVQEIVAHYRKVMEAAVADSGFEATVVAEFARAKKC